MLSHVANFAEQEAAILAQLKFSPDSADDILRDVFTTLRPAISANQTTDPRADFKNLEEKLAKATELICAASKGRFSRTVEFLVSWRGLAILAGAIVVSVNVYYFQNSGDGATAWASTKHGIKVMKADIEGIVDLAELLFKG